MYGKRSRQVEKDSSPGKGLKNNIVDLYAKGNISAQRRASLLADAGDSRVLSCQMPFSTSRARDLQRGLLKQSGWPPLYTCKVPLLGKDGEAASGDVCFLLPHEVLFEMHQVGSYEGLAVRAGLHSCGKAIAKLPSSLSLSLFLNMCVYRYMHMVQRHYCTSMSYVSSLLPHKMSCWHLELPKGFFVALSYKSYLA